MMDHPKLEEYLRKFGTRSLTLCVEMYTSRANAFPTTDGLKEAVESRLHALEDALEEFAHSMKW